MMKLGDLEDYVRKYIPTSLKNIPIVDLLGDQDLDMDQVVKNMRAVECDARSRAMELKYDVGVDSDMLVGDVRVILAGDEADGKVSRPSTLDQQRFEFYEQCKAAYSRATYAQVSVKWNQLKNGDECNESTLKQSVYRVREAKKTRNGA